LPHELRTKGIISVKVTTTTHTPGDLQTHTVAATRPRGSIVDNKLVAIVASASEGGKVKGIVFVFAIVPSPLPRRLYGERENPRVARHAGVLGWKVKTMVKCEEAVLPCVL
jgi:hypothetical protein